LVVWVVNRGLQPQPTGFEDFASPQEGKKNTQQQQVKAGAKRRRKRDAGEVEQGGKGGLKSVFYEGAISRKVRGKAETRGGKKGREVRESKIGLQYGKNFTGKEKNGLWSSKLKSRNTSGIDKTPRGLISIRAKKEARRSPMLGITGDTRSGGGNCDGGEF